MLGGLSMRAKKWFITYQPFACRPTNVKLTGNITELVEHIEMDATRKDNWEKKEKVLGSAYIEGTVLFFHELP